MMKKMMLSLAILGGALLMAQAELKPGDNASDFSLVNVDGTEISLSDYAGILCFIKTF